MIYRRTRKLLPLMVMMFLSCTLYIYLLPAAAQFQPFPDPVIVISHESEAAEAAEAPPFPVRTLSEVPKDCDSGGILHNGECICPSETYSSTCSEDACSNAVSFTITDVWDHDLWKGDVDYCAINPAYICCWKRMYLNSNLTYHSLPTKKTLPMTDNDLQSVYMRYGPWSDTDKLMLRYLVGDLRYTPSDVNHQEDDQSPHLAFVIMGHGYFFRLKKLLDAIYSPRHYYMITVDANVSSDDHAYVLEFVNTYNLQHGTNNVRVLDNRFLGGWGGPALVYQEVAALVELLRVSGEDPWSHVINLSLYDYPVKTLPYIEQFMAENKDISFIDINPYLRTERHKELYLTCGQKIKKVNLDSALCPKTDVENWMYDPGWTYGEGCQWHVLSREFAKFVATSQDALEILFSLKHSLIADEAYFQTVMLNSPFAQSKHVRENLRYLPWLRKLQVEEEDIPVLKSNDRFLFTRKIFNETLLDVIDIEILLPGLLKEPETPEPDHVLLQPNQINLLE